MSLSYQQQDSIYYFKPGQFRDFIKSIADKTATVLDALYSFREVKCLSKDSRNMTIEELLSNPQKIQELYNTLRTRMEPERKPKLPYNKVERQQEMIDSLAEEFSIDIDKAQTKIVTGYYNDGVVAFHYILEAGIAPRTDVGVESAGECTIVGNVNDPPSIDGGEGYFNYPNVQYLG
jgi:hypothetical protein